MTHHQLRSFLARQALFRGLTADEIVRVVDRMDTVEVPAGATIFAEGDPGDAWYVVVKGAVTIQKTTPSGPEHELARLEPGEEFGEMALIDESPRLASAVAEGPTTLARLPREAFEALVAQEGDVAAKVILAMARVLCQRQRELTAVVTDLVDDPQTAQPGVREMLSLLLLPSR